MAQRNTKQTKKTAVAAETVDTTTVVADVVTVPTAEPVAQEEVKAEATTEDVQVGSPQRAYNQRKNLPMDMQV